MRHGYSKFRAKPTVVHGFRFASMAEARRYQELLVLGQAGEIRNLELQPRFSITLGAEKVADYVADFRYEELRRDYQEPEFHRGECVQLGGLHTWWCDVVEDVKGMKTPVYRLKKKLVEAQYGIQIREITR